MTYHGAIRPITALRLQLQLLMLCPFPGIWLLGTCLAVVWGCGCDAHGSMTMQHV